MPSHPTDFLRHALATLAYRAEKALRDPPAGFETFRAAPDSRPALAILAHMGDLMEWGERMTHGERRWEAVPQASWDAAGDRFFRALAALDGALAAGVSDTLPREMIFQGPIADALTHVGQLTMMRGMAGAPEYRRHGAAPPPSGYHSNERHLRHSHHFLPRRQKICP